MTEITDTNDRGRGVICYDAACGICRGGASRLGRTLARRGFRLLPLQSPLARELAGATEEQLLAEVHLVTPDRRTLRGVDALLYVAGTIRWVAPLRWLARVPGAERAMRAAYRGFARRRYRISAVCGLDRSRRARKREDHAGQWMPPLTWLAIALLAGCSIPAWAWMWTLALAMYLGCKWVTWWPFRFDAPPGRGIGYLLGYAGMDARRFLFGSTGAEPARREWLVTAARMIVGATLLWLIPRLLHPQSPMLAGWTAMIGLTLFCHFGLLHLAALAWRRAGVAAEPLMRRPTRATSLADFWGRRWNSGFRTLAHDLLFKPLVRRLGVAGATFVVFLASGIVHDLVISLPARGGYGLPTIYFLTQFAGLLVERAGAVSRLFARRAGLGRFHAVAFAVAPLPLLFHEPFVRRVILPFLHAIGGLP